MHRVLHIQPLAPAKPAPGQPCNGCGVCCVAGPCPAGVLASRSLQGPCSALRWDAGQRLYRCGVMAAVDHPAWRRLAGRSIAAGQGCDCTLEVSPPPG